jgi:GNAT superfamily N-acetyltransferase
MLRELDGSVRAARPIRGLEIRPVDDVEPFLRTPHPMLGPITTPRRRHGLARLRALIAARPQRAWPFAAWLDGQAVGSSLLFMGSECAGLHDLTVTPGCRGRGIGGALLEYTCEQALRLGASSMALLATTDGQRVYERHEFVETARFGYWFRSFSRLR